MSGDFSGGGDVLNIPSLTEMSANTKVNATAVTLGILGAFVKCIYQLGI